MTGDEQRRAEVTDTLARHAVLTAEIRAHQRIGTGAQGTAHLEAVSLVLGAMLAEQPTRQARAEDYRDAISHVLRHPRP